MEITVSSKSQDTFTDGLNYLRNNVSSLTYDNYAPVVLDFQQFMSENPERNPSLAVSNYKNHLKNQGLTPRTINKKLSALRTFFQAQMTLGHISVEVYQAVKNVPNIKVQGRKYGRRLNLETAKELINTPDKTTLLGKRDRVVLGLLLGCGLRRSEVVKVTWDQLYFTGTTWIIRDLVGKHNRTRSVAIPDWVIRLLNEYVPNWQYAFKREGKIVVSFFNGTKRNRGSMSTQAVLDIVKTHAHKIGIEVTAHDLRRTYAALAREFGGVEAMTTIQQQLGHSSIQVTEMYIGEELNFDKAASLFNVEIS